ncbi:MAG: type II toxin-antitoxin system VapC family toxin [Solirubrobacteraceae bacterium]
MALFYLDASALVKLVREESESAALNTFIEDADLVSSELVLTEIPRAIRRAAADDPELSLGQLIEQANDVLDSLATVPVDQAVLVAAGGLPEPALRALDAIHVATALSLSPVDAFVTYDERQGAAARLAGLRTVMPTAQAIPSDSEDVAEPSKPKITRSTPAELASRIKARGTPAPSQPSEITVREIRDHGE